MTEELNPPIEYGRAFAWVTMRITCFYCPFQIEGTARNKVFYFRARHESWWFGIGDNLEEAVTNALRERGGEIDDGDVAMCMRRLGRCINENFAP